MSGKPAAPAAPAAGGIQPALPYGDLLDLIRRGDADPATLQRRVSELLALVDLVGTLGSGLTSEEILDSALLIVMGQLQCRRGCFLVRLESGVYQVRAARGLPAGAAREIAADLSGETGLLGRDSPRAAALLDALQLEVVCPIAKPGGVVAAIALGGRSVGQSFGRADAEFLGSVAACAAAPLESGLMNEQLRRLNQRLSVKVFQLHSLFDISRELVASLDDDAILQVLSAALMGQLMATRCAVHRVTAGGLFLAHARGFHAADPLKLVPEHDASAVLQAVTVPLPAADLPGGPLRDALVAAGMGLIVPLGLGGRADGLIAVGARASSAPYSDEDLDFALTLARQASAALQTVRLHQVRVEKQRQDRELQIARGIQQSLFPRDRPRMPGFELAARSIPCHEVGGDHYDFIPLPGGRWALAVADVSGKGTPASLLMAGVHAWLRALAGTATPVVLMQKLNRFMCENTEAQRYVTLFYGELDPLLGRLVYVNAGHVPPFLLRADGRRERLTDGGPVLGLIEDAEYELGQASLAVSDVLAMVTDGVTEAFSEEEVEVGDRIVFETLSGARAASPEGVLEALVSAVQNWTGEAGCSDDLTALVLKAMPRQ
jgi:sigma-B regulation protein RsbU (phosphoserine phosphatase)